MVLLQVLFLIFIVESVQIQNRYSLGDKYTYSENKTATMVDLFTGEKTIKEVATIYTEHIVQLDDPLTNTSAKIEKTYSFVRFTPSDERASRRLLSQRTREIYYKAGDDSRQYSVGDHWHEDLLMDNKKHTLVTRIYANDQYDTDVITFDTEMLGIITLHSHKMLAHFWIRREIDVQTGILLFEEIIQKHTLTNEQTTEISVKKLIKRQTHTHEL